MYAATPLRYPGGKAKLSGFVQGLLEHNRLLDGHYVEPYAGGAGVALSLLFLDYVSDIHLNDIDRSVYAFWHSAVKNTKALCELIEETPVTIEEWHRQKDVQRRSASAKLLELGFSTFFLNRTNRSGILNAGVIGGKEQTGNWKLDARYNKADLIKRITRIGSYESRIHLTQEDAVKFINDVSRTIPKKSLIYLDPPYYVKGQDLYQNHYMHVDHEVVAKLVKTKLSVPWIVSYDNVPEIKTMYKGCKRRIYDLNYSAADRYTGKEVMFFSDVLTIPRAS